MKHLSHFCLMALISCYSLSITATVAESFAFAPSENKLSVYMGKEEKNVPKSALEMFCGDYASVFGNAPVLTDVPGNADVLIATLEHADGEDWVKSLHLDTKELKGAWEAFRIQVVRQGNRNQLIILGSDERGTAYGILELSRLIGVSPWSWWADVTPAKKKQVLLPATYINEQKPSVQYRGIFINDEDWGLVPWSHNMLEPTAAKGELGPKTYERVFQLLLRLRANIIWPAMHECTKPFYTVAGNKEMADKYGIVIGTSHCEQLMRNNAGEWDKSRYGDYNYLTNKETVLAYWKERLQEVGSYQNFYTIGMRGVHDGKMEGPKTLDEQTALTATILNDQRKLLATYVSPAVTSIPQAIILYKEVLDVYNNGLKVPDDVTLVWCDDNYGYITRLSNEEEQKRKGGAGVYYHISYWGRPHDYLWLCTTPPTQIYTEMKRAWDYGSRKLWILNVGDIKPAEYETEFFMDMAWNITAVNPQKLNEHLQAWLSREFGEDLKEPLSRLKQEYYRLATIRKPEFMGWSRVEEPSVPGGKTPVRDTEFNPFMFGDEVQRRIEDYSRLSDKARALAKRVPTQRRDAYFELMEYPICASAAMNHKLLYAQKARLLARYNLPAANEYDSLSKRAYEDIVSLTYTYNQNIAKGKWKGIMDMKPRKLAVFDSCKLPRKVIVAASKSAMVWVEGDSLFSAPETVIKLPSFINGKSETTFVSFYNRGKKQINWHTEHKPDWLKVVEISMPAKLEKRILISVDWSKLKENAFAQMQLIVDGQEYKVDASAIYKAAAKKVEFNGMVAWNAADWDTSSYSPVEITNGLGYSRKSISLPKGETLTYDVEVFSTGKCCLRVGLIPNHPLNGGQLCYQVSIDGKQQQVITYNTEVRSEPWKINVLRNLSLNTSYHLLPLSGKHIISIKALDNGIILDQMMLDFQPGRSFYEIPVPDINKPL
ncbi:glycosyl hydrolase 115 family protein [uncultured Bacteroides sp.]|uniref:glycosyl hydrolase 115 family protein n=1 Tax=uncultured Bacteroides sp. TaxID=162156 RepID=UPI002AA95038|nr:glycosyl hydrolase 115 family protein [uncultured Bacteroides sp.]